MQLSILLVTFLRLEETINCLKSIGKNTGNEFEVILTDNGSPEEMQQSLRELEQNLSWLKVHLLPRNIGLCLGMEHSFKKSKGRYVALLNNDMTVTENWDLRAIERLESVENAGCVGLRVIEDGYVKCFYRNIAEGQFGLQFSHALDVMSKDDRRASEEKEVDIVHDGAVIYRRQVLEKLEFCPQYFFNLEGFDLMMQTKRLGYKILTSTIDVFHFPSTREDKYSKFRRIDLGREYQKSRQIFLERWGVRP